MPLKHDRPAGPDMVAGGDHDYLEVINREMTMKTPEKKRGYIGNILAVFGAAVNASAAVETRRMPRAADLVTLGIDPKSFPDVRRGI